MMTLKETCEIIGITVDQYREWLKRARDNKVEYLFITIQEGDDQPYPYHVAKREDIDWQRDQLQDEGIRILAEIMI